MNVKARVILTILLIFEGEVYAQILEHLNLEHPGLTMTACDLMTVSYSGARRGKSVKPCSIYTNMHLFLLVFGGGTISFQSFNYLLDTKDKVKFRSLMARMSCLVTIADLKSDTEFIQLLDLVKDIKISQKYVTIFIKTLNSTVLKNRTINFNVIFKHKDKGKF